ncbi:hypothetical protein BMS3Abin01_01274 [bacterium BMS3Abin01]|nr:hypothetical protein BMS3Abin01_01274 [bacterium BMS3Abin01]
MSTATVLRSSMPATWPPDWGCWRLRPSTWCFWTWVFPTPWGWTPSGGLWPGSTRYRLSSSPAMRTRPPPSRRPDSRPRTIWSRAMWTERCWLAPSSTLSSANSPKWNWSGPTAPSKSYPSATRQWYAPWTNRRCWIMSAGSSSSTAVTTWSGSAMRRMMKPVASAPWRNAAAMTAIWTRSISAGPTKSVDTDRPASPSGPVKHH